MIILDTNVLSEVARQYPDPNVIGWLREQALLDLATTTICVAELRCGIARLPVGQRRNALEKKLFAFLSRGIANRTRIGRPLEGFDGLIAAIALSRNAAIATRNVNDFDGCGIDVINPWSPLSGSKV